MNTVYCHCDKSIAEACPCDVELMRLRKENQELRDSIRRKRALLKWYMSEVVSSEGTFFIGPVGDLKPNFRMPGIDDAQWAELHEIAAEIEKESKN